MLCCIGSIVKDIYQFEFEDEYFLEEENFHPKIPVQLLLLKGGRNLQNGKGQLFSRLRILSYGTNVQFLFFVDVSTL